jgi:hypothetical protein
LQIAAVWVDGESEHDGAAWVAWIVGEERFCETVAGL